MGHARCLRSTPHVDEDNDAEDDDDHDDDGVQQPYLHSPEQCQVSRNQCRRSRSVPADFAQLGHRRVLDTTSDSHSRSFHGDKTRRHFQGGPSLGTGSLESIRVSE